MCRSGPSSGTGDARKNLKLLLAANKRLITVYLLKESFAQLWDYTREPWARKFFENWRDCCRARLSALVVTLTLERDQRFDDHSRVNLDVLLAKISAVSLQALGHCSSLDNQLRPGYLFTTGNQQRFPLPWFNGHTN